MAKPCLRFLSVLIASAAAAWYALEFLPSGPVDRFLVKVMASTTANPPFIIAGAGTQDSPWSLRVLAPYQKADPKHGPAVVSLGDDKEGIFQSSPPSPVDLAVVLRNMRRLGAERPAISALLAWEEPEVIAISALDSALESFPAVTTASPLSRGATGTPISPTFRRASIAPSQVRGDITKVPTVNRLPLPGVILGGDNAYSGFTLLEHDPGGSPMLARWDDRFVLSFPLVSVLVERGLPFDGVEIELGNFIKLGAKGPYIPIDATGRISTAPGKATDSRMLRAELLGDMQEGTPLAGPGLVMLRDDQSNAEAPTRAFSARVGPLLADISSGAGMSREQILTRSEDWRELTILGIAAVLLAMPFRRRRFGRGVIYAVVAAAALAIHLTAFLTTSVWPPTLAVLAAVGGAFFVSHLFFRDTEKAPEEQPAPSLPADTAPAEVVAPAAAAVAEPTTPPAKEAAAKKVAARKATVKKTTAKKAATKKVVAKKTPAKKAAAKKSAGRKKNPPSS
ncbi:hypothetical protein OVA24_07140 [Luteolibacter sp. SL250]|uniref:hypothetical protein n=1 Tax=Luteolibacter sp. SL250 TaxID=2995170 RepID=UPI0022705B23|nr:hypothetical protein [Luteolibacter sp. SL250]WAC21156.1 hypothetical protein OVA24_07140 [Luteolibacter sp. SL250]